MVSSLVARSAAAAAALVLLLGGSGPAAAACQPISELSFADPEAGTAVRLDRNERELVFTTADGRKLYAKNTRIVGQHRIVAVANNHNLTILLRADLRTGRVQATAIERELGVVSRPDPRTRRDRFRHVHVLTLNPPASERCG